jgi:hypothetical protein
MTQLCWNTTTRYVDVVRLWLETTKRITGSGKKLEAYLEQKIGRSVMRPLTKWDGGKVGKVFRNLQLWWPGHDPSNDNHPGSHSQVEGGSGSRTYCDQPKERA